MALKFLNDGFFDGKVGIGTDSPTVKFHVLGQDATFYSGTTTQQMNIGRNAGERIEIFIDDNTNKIRAIQDSEVGVDFSFILDRSIIGTDLDAVHNFEIQKDGTAQVLIDKDGNVGIGTTTPSAKLEITGSTPTAGDTTLHLRLPAGNVTAGTTEMGNILFSSTDSSFRGSGSIAKISTIAGNGFNAWTGAGRPTDLAFFTQPLGAAAELVEAMRIDQDGKVGIGTSSPIDLLALHNKATGAVDAQMNFTTAATGQGVGDGFRVGWNGTVAQMYLFENADMRIATNNEERIRILSGGNVGIGETNPQSKLQVDGGISVGDGTTRSEIKPPTSGNANMTFAANAGNANTAVSEFIFTNSLDGSSTRNESMRIDSAGNVGIGATSPGAKLHIIGSGGNGGILFNNASSQEHRIYSTTNTQFNLVGSNSPIWIFGQSDISNNLNGTAALDLRKTGAAFSGKATTPSTVSTDAATTLATKDYVDAHGGGVGPFLPVANPTFTGELTGPSADLEFIKLTSANPGVHLKETDTTDKNWDIQVNGGNLKFYEVNDARSVFNELVTFEAGGNVGIGRTNPSRLLEVNGVQGWSASETEMAALNPATNGVDFFFKDASGNVMIRLDGRPNANSFFNSGGNVGIGNNNPTEKLTVNDSVNDIQMRVGSLTAGISPIIRLQGRNTANSEQFFTDIELNAETGVLLLNDPGTSSSNIGENPVSIDSEGNLGVGTTNPAAQLQVVQTASANTATFENATQTVSIITIKAAEVLNNYSILSFSVGDNLSSTDIFAEVAGQVVNDGGALKGDLVFNTNQGDDVEERMRILSDGNVGIGTSTPTSGGADAKWLTMNGNATSTYSGGISYTINSVSKAFSYFQSDYLIQQCLSGFGQKFIVNGVNQAMIILSNGNVGIGNTNPVGEIMVGSNWDSVQSPNLYIKESTPISSFDPRVINTSDLGITYATTSTNTAGPDKVGLTLHNNAGVAGQFSPMLIFSSKESGVTPFKSAMAAIYSRSPLATGTSGEWNDGELIFATAGATSEGIVQRMVINKEGLVGIGTTNPTERLVVNGSVNSINQSANFSTGPYRATMDIISSIKLVRIGSVKGAVTPTGDEGEVAFFVNSVEKARIDKDGNFGIGITNPTAKLHVSGGDIQTKDTTGLNGVLRIRGSATGTPSYGYPNVGAGDAVIEGGGGSSTRKPGVITLVNGDSTISANQDLGVIQFVGKDDVTNGYASSQIIGTSNTAAGAPGNSGGGILRFLTSEGLAISEKMRIAANGKVGIGTEDPTAPLQVVGIAEYTNNTTALAAGLTAGAFYRTGDDLKVVH